MKPRNWKKIINLFNQVSTSKLYNQYNKFNKHWKIVKWKRRCKINKLLYYIVIKKNSYEKSRYHVSRTPVRVSNSNVLHHCVTKHAALSRPYLVLRSLLLFFQPGWKSYYSLVGSHWQNRSSRLKKTPCNSDIQVTHTLTKSVVAVFLLVVTKFSVSLYKTQ